MTEIGISADDEALRIGLEKKRTWSGGMMGIAICLAVVLGASWPVSTASSNGWPRVAQAGSDSVSPPTVAFSQALRCRLKTILAESPVIPSESFPKEPVRMQTPCDTRYVAVSSESFPETPQKNALKQLLADTPMESLIDSLMGFQPTTRALAVGIAKQESNWGSASPRKSGRDCYNYWGYKGAGQNGSVSGGYACFATPEEAVGVVVGRIDTLVEKGLTTPQKMLVWKCGASCATHSPESVSRWVNVVNGYYRQLNQG